MKGPNQCLEIQTARAVSRMYSISPKPRQKIYQLSKIPKIPLTNS